MAACFCMYLKNKGKVQQGTVFIACSDGIPSFLHGGMDGIAVSRQQGVDGGQDEKVRISVSCGGRIRGYPHLRAGWRDIYQ